MNVIVAYSQQEKQQQMPQTGETGGVAICRHGLQTHHKSQLQVAFVTISH